MNRRSFIKKTGIASSVLGVAGTSLLTSTWLDANASAKKITILHTNDVHSRIDAFDSNHSKYANRGGVARRYAYIKMVKEENPNTLVLDAGDSFQGTPYFNFYGGELEFKLMSKMGYHASTLGNHEFDNGIENIAAQLQHAEFSMLNANYNFKNTILDGLVKPYQTYEMDGIKIGVFGLGIQLEGLVSKKFYKETQYNDPVEITTDIVKQLKEEEECDLVICLSHLGYNYSGRKICDIKLAQRTRNIDLIIGGHTHTFLEKPTIVENLDFKTVLVNQVGWAGLNVGRIDFYMKKAKATDEAVIEL